MITRVVLIGIFVARVRPEGPSRFLRKNIDRLENVITNGYKSLKIKGN